MLYLIQMTYITGKHFWVIVVTLFLFWPKIVSATNSPVLKSPPDNSASDKTPKLIWEFSGQCITDGSCFRIEVDNNSDFSSPEKSSYTNSFSYSPQGLTEGVYFWRVKAKDVSEKWSDWSSVFKFNTSLASSVPTSSPSVTVSSKPSSSPLSENNNDNRFEVKDLKREISSDEEIEVNVIISESQKPNTSFHIKGAFRQGDSINYFGETFFSGEWSKNNSAYSRQPVIQTDQEGRWEGKIKVRPDSFDSGFKGTGEYFFKVGRYTASGNGPVWSNELSIKINEVTRPEPSPQTEIEDEEAAENENTEAVNLIRPIPSFNYDYQIASVAGEATKSDNISLDEQTQVLREKKVNWLLIILGIGILVSGISYGVYQIKYKK